MAATLLSILILSHCTQDVSSTHSLKVQTGVVQADGISLAYESFGEEKDEAILMIQGTAAQLTAWPIELCQQLAAPRLSRNPVR